MARRRQVINPDPLPAVEEPNKFFPLARQGSKYFQERGFSMEMVVIATAWCVAELAWKFNEHIHTCIDQGYDTTKPMSSR